jgi:tight adherence protein B
LIYIVLILIFLFFWALTAAILLAFFNKSKPIDKLKYFDEDYVLKEKYEGNKKSKVSFLKLLSTFIPSSKLNRNRTKKLELELMRADMPITIEELLVIKILFSSSLTFLAFALFKSYVMLPIVFILVWKVPKLVIATRKKERIKVFDSQLNEGIMIISNALKAGYSFLQALAVASEETPDPFSKEFKKMLKEMTLGISEEEALKNLLLRMESEDLRLIMNAILIQKDIGGNLSEILDNIGETIRERQKIKGELKTLTAQGKLSGLIVILIPIFLGCIIYIFNKEYMMLLFNNPIGIAMVTFAVVNQIIGVFMIKKVVNIDI